MDDMPPWVSMMTDDAVVRSVLEEMFRNGQFRDELDAAFAKDDERDRLAFTTYVGDARSLGQFNAPRPQDMRVNLDPNTGAVAMLNAADGPPEVGGIFVDVDRLHAATQQDSAAARTLVRDAFLHEFAHLLPVAAARDMSAFTGDPEVGSRDQASHPVMQGENRLRALFGLPPKTVYGLMGEVKR